MDFLQTMKYTGQHTSYASYKNSVTGHMIALRNQIREMEKVVNLFHPEDVRYDRLRNKIVSLSNRMGLLSFNNLSNEELLDFINRHTSNGNPNRQEGKTTALWRMLMVSQIVREILIIRNHFNIVVVKNHA